MSKLENNILPSENKRDKSIVFIRVLAMWMILICHIANRLSVGAIAQLFQVGVQIFLLISGYLCAMRPPKSLTKWLAGRARRIFIPIWIFVLVCTVGFIFNPNLSPLGFLLSGFGVYGVNHIFTLWELPSVAGLEHLWYITLLLISYIFLALYFSIGEESAKKRNITLGILVALQIILAFFAVRIDYIVIFFVGYAIYHLKSSAQKYAVLSSNIVAVVLVAVRFLMSRSESLSEGGAYLYFVIPFCYNFLALAAFYDLRLIFSVLKLGEIPLLDKIVTHTDGISYEVYIVHYIFIEGIFSVYADSSEWFIVLLETVIFLIVTFGIAELLHLLSTRVNKLFEKRKKVKKSE